MKDLKFFLRQNAALPKNEEVEVTQRFKDENGNPIKFEIAEYKTGKKSQRGICT